jgi:hypothetical protein
VLRADASDVSGEGTDVYDVSAALSSGEVDRAGAADARIAGGAPRVGLLCPAYMNSSGEGSAAAGDCLVCFDSKTGAGGLFARARTGCMLSIRGLATLQTPNAHQSRCYRSLASTARPRFRRIKQPKGMRVIKDSHPCCTLSGDLPSVAIQDAAVCKLVCGSDAPASVLFGAEC